MGLPVPIIINSIPVKLDRAVLPIRSHVILCDTEAPSKETLQA
jgi:hypothetical protein